MSRAGPPQAANPAPAGGSEAREPDGPLRGRTPECEARKSSDQPRAWGDHTNQAIEQPPVSRYPVPRIEDLPEDIRARMLEVQDKAGFIPNVFLALAHRPDEFRAFFAYHDALMLKESGLTKAEREMIVVATSGANDCLYCIVAHGAVLRIYARDPLIADQVAVNYRKADISPRQKAMLDFAVKVARRSAGLVDADFEALRRHGFSDEDIWDIGAIAAFFALSNRMADLVAMRPNDEFHLMGRIPKPATK